MPVSALQSQSGYLSQENRTGTFLAYSKLTYYNVWLKQVIVLNITYLLVLTFFSLFPSVEESVKTSIGDLSTAAPADPVVK